MQSLVVIMFFNISKTPYAFVDVHLNTYSH